MPCASYDSAGLNPFCCGLDYTCCNSSQNIITTIARFTTMFRAAGATETSSTSPSTTLPTSNASSQSSTTSSQPATTTAVASSGAVSETLIIGAGVGIPLGLAIVVALTFLGWQIRKQNKLKEKILASACSPSSLHSDPGSSVYDASQRSYQSKVDFYGEMSGTQLEPVELHVHPSELAAT